MAILTIANNKNNSPTLTIVNLMVYKGTKKLLTKLNVQFIAKKKQVPTTNWPFPVF